MTLCPGCAQYDHRRNAAYCPLCQRELSQVEARNFITPFWQRIPAFFLYPAHPTPLVFILVLALALTVLSVGLFTLIIAAFLGLGFLRYAMEVLRRTADGDTEPPGVSFELMTEGLGLPLKQLAIYVIVVVLVGWVAAQLGPLAGQLAALAVFVSLPAMIMVLVVEDSLSSALNPMIITPFIQRIGLAYFVMYLFLLLITGIHSTVSYFLAASPLSAIMALQYMVDLYALLIMYHMMGYLIFQYHEELGYSVALDLDRGDAHARTGMATQGGVGDAEVLIKEGRLDEAIDRLERKLTEQRLDLGLNEALHKVLSRAGRVEKLLRHGQDYVDLLLSERKLAKAADVFVAGYEHDHGFRPSNPDHYHALANILAERRRFNEALALSRDFHKRFPDHPDTPRLYLLAARILAEELGQARKAHELLSRLVKRYGDHEIGGEIARYAKVVEGLLAADG